MRKLLKKTKPPKGLRNYKLGTGLLAVIAVAGVGTYLLLQSHALTPYIASEAESGNLSPSAIEQPDSTASDGKYVQFGTASTSGGCTNAGVVAPCIGSPNTGASGWGTPVFDDEFDESTLDTTKWCSSWFNGGSMNNVKTSPANVAVSGGNIILTLSSSSSGALVDTNPNDCGRTGFTYTTGYYVEARVFFPGNGTNIDNWPAFWTDGQSWPADGEIDVAEGLGTLTSNYHSNSGANNSNTIPGNWAGGFHTYAVERKVGMNNIYWDGKLVRSYATDDGGSPHYLIFNVGSGEGPAVYGTGSQVKVDYVRVWK